MNLSSLTLKKFEDYGSRISRKISLNKSCSFGLPPTFLQDNKLEDATRVILYFDEEQFVIGLRFTTGNDQEEGFKLVPYGQNSKTGASFIARSFFNKYNLDPEKYQGKYEPEIIEDMEGKIFAFQLKERTNEA